jgi:hypothetical protein
MHQWELNDYMNSSHKRQPNTTNTNDGEQVSVKLIPNEKRENSMIVIVVTSIILLLALGIGIFTIISNMSLKKNRISVRQFF